MDRASGEWLAFAETDLGVARHLLETYRPQPLEIICYHCQQSAEKAIKAVIVAHGAQGGMPKLHDLSFLLDQVKNAIKIDERYYDAADALTPYGVAVRYPSELALEERHARSALRHAEALLDWAKINCE
ncbi:MAG: HEPN domain-containing protein [Oscillospiraceae bacterium]|nr:HEPN domain-containing protein [Oscillospiraceae bacterium]